MDDALGNGSRAFTGQLQGHLVVVSGIVMMNMISSTSMTSINGVVLSALIGTSGAGTAKEGSGGAGAYHSPHT